MLLMVVVIYINIILELFGSAIVMSEMIDDLWLFSLIETHGSPANIQERLFRHMHIYVDFSKTFDFSTHMCFDRVFFSPSTPQFKLMYMTFDSDLACLHNRDLANTE